MCDASRASVVLEALLQASCWDLVLASLRTALESGADEGSSPAALLPHATAEQELVALLSVVQVRGRALWGPRRGEEVQYGWASGKHITVGKLGKRLADCR